MKLHDSLVALLEHDKLFGPNGICEVYLEADINSIKEKPLLIITGDNASGKSFMCNGLTSFLRKETDTEVSECYKVLPMLFGMSRRTMPDISRAFIYGDEGNSSTGEISLNCILGAIKNSQQYDTKHAIMLDEPDIGLSDAFLPSLGEYIGDYYKNLPENAEGLVIVTHNRTLVKALMKHNPVTIRVGSQQSTVDWLENGPALKTIDELLTLKEEAHKRFIAIDNYMRRLRQAK